MTTPPKCGLPAMATIHIHLRAILSRRLVLAVLAGLSILLAGYFLNKRRRRYRAVATSLPLRGQVPLLQRSCTFQAEAAPLCGSGETGLFSSEPYVPQLHNYSDDEDFVEAADLLIIPQYSATAARAASPPESVSTSDSFHSTVDELPPHLPLPPCHQLYHTGLQHAMQGQVLARTLRTEELCCSGDIDFLAKLYCVRLAFDELTAEVANRQYFQQMGRELMSTFLTSTGHDPALFCERYDGLVCVLMQEEGQRLAEQELKERRVVVMNVYDVALDFVLLDAFSDLEHPPSTVLAVLQNTWITDGMKKSALSAAVWSLLKAKRSMLGNKDGFMGQFYLLSEVLTPVMSWGFLGTDLALKQHCLSLKATITQFLQGVFSLDRVRYSTVSSLADDILMLAHNTADSVVHHL